MRTIIAGSRTITEYDVLLDAINELPWHITEVVSGGARGADALGEQFARDHELPLRIFPADWDKHGKSAGPMRNQEMARYANALLALWDGQSRGTDHMIRTARRNGLQVKVKLITLWLTAKYLQHIRSVYYA